MANRLDVTTATGESAVWSPTDESILQMSAADSRARVQIMARVDATANWEEIITLNNLTPESKFARLPKYPFLKAVIARNTAGSAVKIWDNL